jgi:hypothetical protein
MTDAFQPYRDMLAGKDVPIHADQPYPGRYKMKRGNRFVAVLINHDSEGNLKAAVGSEILDAASVWTYCAKHPITKAAYDAFNENGRFPGEIEIGHNSGDLSLAEEIKDAVAQTREWIGKTKITDKTIADEAANRRARLLDLGKKADKERDEKKRPHLEAGRAIDAEYKPLVEAATSAANAIRDVLTQWMRAEEAKQRAEAEAARKAEEERLAKERAAHLAANPIAEFTDEPPLPLAPVEPPKIQAGGQAGRKAGLRTVTRYELTDYEAALAHVKNHKDVIAAVEKAAFAQAKAGAEVPGVKTISERVAA